MPIGTMQKASLTSCALSFCVAFFQLSRCGWELRVLRGLHLVAVLLVAKHKQTFRVQGNAGWEFLNT